MLLALTREVSPNLGSCELTYLQREAIDPAIARAQHQQYEQCLTDLGCAIHRLPAAPDLPDGVFVEDTCIVLDELAVMTRPGAESRRPETESVAAAMRVYRPLFWIEPPATLDGGDVLCLEKHVYAGLSQRTNRAGIDHLQSFLVPHGYSVTAAPLAGCLHLKSAVTRIGSSFSKTLKTGAAERRPKFYTGKHEDGASRDSARRKNAVGRGVAGDYWGATGSGRVA